MVNFKASILIKSCKIPITFSTSQISHLAATPSSAVFYHQLNSYNSALRDPCALQRRSLHQQSPILNMDQNGSLRTKRKKSPVNSVERPTKQLKPELVSPTNGDESFVEAPSYSLSESEEEDGRVLPLAAVATDTAEWQATIEKVVRNVVSINFSQTHSFDADAACSTEATGFVVDAERGYILTNRHVVSPGPFWGFCVFDNHEEVSVPLTHASTLGFKGGRCISLAFSPEDWEGASSLFCFTVY